MDSALCCLEAQKYTFRSQEQCFFPGWSYLRDHLFLCVYRKSLAASSSAKDRATLTQSFWHPGDKSALGAMVGPDYLLMWKVYRSCLKSPKGFSDSFGPAALINIASFFCGSQAIHLNRLMSVSILTLTLKRTMFGVTTNRDLLVGLKHSVVGLTHFLKYCRC